jgi:integrase
VTGLRWESVDLADQRISVRTSKTGERVILPIHEQLLEYLLALPTPANASDPLFAELSQRKTSGNGGLSMAFARIMKEAGICGRRSEAKGDKGRARNSLSFHALRHSFNSNLMNAGVDQETRQKLTGHRSKAMNDKYTHVELETLRGAISKLTSI